MVLSPAAVRVRDFQLTARRCVPSVLRDTFAAQRETRGRAQRRRVEYRLKELRGSEQSDFPLGRWFELKHVQSSPWPNVVSASGLKSQVRSVRRVMPSSTPSAF